ncbi:MAG: ABC transporter substrate-binding protein [Promethearchaeota archaeon]
MNHKKILPLVLVAVMTASMVFVAVQPVKAQSPVFTCVLMAPTNNELRVQHAQLIANELPKIGIGVTLLLVGWDVLLPRLFEPSGPLALGYAQGGYDMACLGWGGGLLPTTQHWLFHSTYTPNPNYFGVQNTTLDDLLQFTVNTTDEVLREQYIEDAWEQITWHLQAEITLYQTQNVVYMRDNVEGYTSNLRVPGNLGLAEMYFDDGKSQGHGQKNEFIMAGTTRPDDYNDMIENNWYNTMAIGMTNHALIERDPYYGFLPVLLTKLPYPVAVKNNHTDIVSSTFRENATVWEIELRDDVYWHEGYGYTMEDDNDTLLFDADDVVFTMNLYLNENGPKPQSERPLLQLLFGEDASLAVVKVDSTHVQFHLRYLDADLMALFGIRMYPEHILGLGTVRADGSMAPTDYTGWETDDWNVGVRSGNYKGPAVIGNGPYILDPGENAIARTVTLTKNPYWHLIDEPAYANMFDKYIYTWITSKDAALIALEKAEIDMMDPQFHAEKDYYAMINKPGIFTLKSLDWGCQTLGINVANGANGHLSDVNVRLAISHMMPREDMVDYLLSGLGETAFMHFPRQNPFYPEGVKPIEYNFSKAIEYMEAAGYDMDRFKTTTTTTATAISTSGFEALAFFVALDGMAAVVLVYRHKKR